MDSPSPPILPVISAMAPNGCRCLDHGVLPTSSRSSGSRQGVASVASSDLVRRSDLQTSSRSGYDNEVIRKISGRVRVLQTRVLVEDIQRPLPDIGFDPSDRLSLFDGISIQSLLEFKLAGSKLGIELGKANLASLHSFVHLLAPVGKALHRGGNEAPYQIGLLAHHVYARCNSVVQYVDPIVGKQQRVDRIALVLDREPRGVIVAENCVDLPSDKRLDEYTGVKSFLLNLIFFSAVQQDEQLIH